MAVNRTTQVYVVFFGFSNDAAHRILGDLENKCKGVEFLGGEAISYPGKDSLDYRIQINPDLYVDDQQNRSVLQKIAALKPDLDGLLLFFGQFCDKRFLLTGLPMVLVDYNAFPSLQIGFKSAVSIARRHGARFLTASLSETDVSQDVSDTRTEDLVNKIGFFKVLRRIKETRILDIQTRGFGAEPHEHWWRMNQEEYLHELKACLGMDAVIADYRDLFEELDQIDEEEAKEIGQRWIDESDGIQDGRTQEDVIRTAKLYLATKELMERLDANAITMDCMTWHLKGGRYDMCGSLGITELQKEGVPAVCESDMDGLVTDVLGNYLTGGQGFLGDFMIDMFNNVTVYAHCQAPLNPHGEDRFPYTIREHGGRTVLQVKLPAQGVITALRVNLPEKKISVHTGELVDGEAIYKDFRELSCRTKLVARVSATRIHQNYDYATFTNHPLVYYGDIREKVQDLARLIGFQVIEEDKLREEGGR